MLDQVEAKPHNSIKTYEFESVHDAILDWLRAIDRKLELDLLLLGQLHLRGGVRLSVSFSFLFGQQNNNKLVSHLSCDFRKLTTTIFVRICDDKSRKINKYWLKSMKSTQHTR